MRVLFSISFILVLLSTSCQKQDQPAQLDPATANQLQSDLTAARTANASVVMWHDSALHCTQPDLIRHCDSMMCIYDGQFHASCSMFTEHHSQSMNGMGMTNGGGGMMGGSNSGMSGSSFCSGNMQQMMNDLQSLQSMHTQFHPDCSSF